MASEFAVMWHLSRVVISHVFGNGFQVDHQQVLTLFDVDVLRDMFFFKLGFVMNVPL